MEDLVQFLRDRLDEDERAARKASSSRKSGGEWQFVDMQVRAGDGAPVTAHTWVGEGTHIARHDPARVLAEVENKRAMVDDYERSWNNCAKLSAGGIKAADVEEWKRQDQAAQTLKPHLLSLASLHSGHPDYRQEWRP